MRSQSVSVGPWTAVHGPGGSSPFCEGGQAPQGSSTASELRPGSGSDVVCAALLTRVAHRHAPVLVVDLRSERVRPNAHVRLVLVAELAVNSSSFELREGQRPRRSRLAAALPSLPPTERTTVTTPQAMTAARNASSARLAAIAVSTPTSSGPK